MHGLYPKGGNRMEGRLMLYSSWCNPSSICSNLMHVSSLHTHGENKGRGRVDNAGMCPTFVQRLLTT